MTNLVGSRQGSQDAPGRAIVGHRPQVEARPAVDHAHPPGPLQLGPQLGHVAGLDP